MVLAVVLNPSYKLSAFQPGRIKWKNVIIWCKELYSDWFGKEPENLMAAFEQYSESRDPFDAKSVKGERCKKILLQICGIPSHTRSLLCFHRV